MPHSLAHRYRLYGTRAGGAPRRPDDRGRISRPFVAVVWGLIKNPGNAVAPDHTNRRRALASLCQNQDLSQRELGGSLVAALLMA
jgi:hypothetical protein